MSARILLVDDEPFNLDLLEQELGDLGYQTISAVNGRQAVELATTQAPDLILLDVMMPVMDGFEACRRLKESETTCLIPVVIMTALGATEDRIRGIEAGADDFLTKPVDARELRARIQTALRQKRVVDRRLDEANRLKDHFAKFVPEPVKQRLARDPGAWELGDKREQDVTVLFLDISGYSRLSQEVPPGELNALVERYFSAYLDRIQRAGADINETAGDGFMAIFEAAEQAAHAWRAADTALELLQTTEALNREDAARPLQVHMGLNSGTALVGTTRFAGARGTRWTFTASGAVTNLAARLAAAASPGQILVGPQTAGHLAGRYELQDVGRVALRNLGEPVAVSVLVRLRG
ncbi:MAG: response regulator [Candidatus Latescibacterota bacterium]